MTTKNEIKILKAGECPSLSGNTTICYSVGLDGKNVMLKIDNISSSAIFNSYWVNVNDILDVFNDAPEKFSSSVLHSTLFKGLSVNTGCFYTSIAKHLKLITPDKRKFVKGDPKEFLASIPKLIKPIKKTPKKKSVKA